MADPAKLARAQHSYNLLIGLDMTVPERAALLDEVLIRAGMAPLGEAGMTAVAKGRVASLSETGLSSEALDGLTDALLAVDLTTVISEFLVALTGVPTGEPGPMPESEPVAESPEVAEVPVEPEADWAWDVVLSLFDPIDRRHHLTLLRSGGSVCSEPVAASEGFGPLIDRLAQTLPDVDPVLLEQASETFHTPDCPDEEALLATLLEGAQLEQVYVVQIRHSLPNPCLHRQRFQLAEPGDNARWQGRTQALMTEVSYRPAGLSMHNARARTDASWGSPARLQRRGQDVNFRPPILAPGALTALPLQCDWQLRAGWSVRCTALHPDGPQATIATSAALDGEIILDGRGHLQEHLAGGIGLAAGVRDASGHQVCTGEAPLPDADWDAAADVGFGALGVVSDSGEHDLTRSGAHLSDATRPAPGIKPRVTWQTPLSDQGMLSSGVLTGAAVIDATAKLHDALNDAQSIGSMSARCQLAATLHLSFSGGNRSLTLRLTDPGASSAGEPTDLGDGLTRIEAAAPAGVIEVDSAVRYGLDWKTTTTTLTSAWTDALDAISDGDWLGGGESLREAVEGHNTVEVAWVAGGYGLCEAVEAEE
ncbi:MAG: hypothetical protein ACI8RZ_000880 [Myxococcota bacterium]|jgi:hypothetical protein